jgi:hypothetical protein
MAFLQSNIPTDDGMFKFRQEESLRFCFGAHSKNAEIIRQRLDINERSYNRLIKRYQTLVDGPLKDQSEM